MVARTKMSLSKLKEALSSGHIAMVLLGMVLSAGIAWGTGTQKILGHDRDIADLKARVESVESEQRSEIREMRQEINTRLNHIESMIRSDMKGRKW